MEIFETNYKDLSAEGVDFELIDPITKEPFGIEDDSGKVVEAFSLRLLAFSAAPVKAFDRRFRKLHPARDWNEEESREYRVGICGAACVGWKGSRVAFSKDAASKLFSQDWIAGKVFAFILDGDRFLSA